MGLVFEPISLDRQAEYTKLFESCRQAASDYTFANLWGWAEEYSLSWAWDGDLVWIRQEKPPACYWAPVGKWEEIDWQKRCSFFAGRSRFMRVPEELIRIWQAGQLADRMKISQSRQHWDYLYSCKELIELRGNRFHKKKNLFSQFQSSYEYQYVPMEESMLEQTLRMQADWCAWKNCEASAGLTAENRVIERILLDWHHFARLLGGVILINQEVAAFTVGELVHPDTLVIHIEKGVAEYKGIYQAINKFFLEANPRATRVNREQDLGKEGLRKAKMSYHPIDFIKKFTVELD
jgi:hypothetical protein